MNITSTPTGWEGGGRAGSHGVVGKGYIFTKTSQTASISAIFTSTYHTKQLNPRPNSSLSSASCVLNYSRLSVWQGDMEPFKGDLSTRGRLTSLRKTSHSKSSLGNLQHQYLPAWIVSKCVQLSFNGENASCCCVCLRQLFWNPFTICRVKCVQVSKSFSYSFRFKH